MENKQINYFVWINRILTNALSGIIGTVTAIGVYYGLITVLNIPVSDLQVLSFLLFVVVLFSLFLGSQVYQILQNYFCHILEKEKYVELSKKMMMNLLANLVFFIVCIIMGFIVLTQTEQATVWAIAAYVVMCFLFGHVLREKEDSLFFSANLIGVTIGIFVMSLVVMTAAKQSLGLGIVVSFMCFPILALINSSLEFLAIALKSVTESPDNVEIN